MTRLNLPKTLTKNTCAVLALALLLSACGEQKKTKSAANAPVQVTTVRAVKRDVPVLVQTSGSVMPLSSVEVKPQTSSVVTQVHLREGQFVRAGQLLFTLDARRDAANVAQAQAQLAQTQAALLDIQRQLTRSKQLLAQNFVSQGAVDTIQAQADAHAANVAAAQAALNAARVALSYDRVTAPSSGRSGAVNVYPGSNVQANVTTLVTITQLDPIAVAFSLPQRQLADALAAMQSGGAVVTATLPDGGEQLNGRLQFVDNVVDSSGMVKVKAIFANPAGKLWPGAFVQVALTVRTLKDAVVLPQTAIVQGARGTVVYVVEAGKAVLKPVQVLYAQGLDAAVSGVQVGEATVLDGKQNLRPGAAVVDKRN